MRTTVITAEHWRARLPPAHRARGAEAVERLPRHQGLSVDDLVDSHLPLAELVAGLVGAHRERWRVVRGLAPALGQPRPFLVGVTGGVAAGKTVTADVLSALLEADGTVVGVVSTDGFLLPNRELERLGLTDRKGFPESYDHQALIEFFDDLVDVDRDPGVALSVPVYDHGAYDVTGEHTDLPPAVAVVIVEGLNVLQPSPSASLEREVGDFLDLSVYLDASGEDIRAWFLQRLQRLRVETADDPASFFSGFAGASDEEFLAMGAEVWAGVNEPNLVDHIAPSRDRANLVIEKGADHAVRQVRLRIS